MSIRVFVLLFAVAASAAGWGSEKLAQYQRLSVLRTGRGLADDERAAIESRLVSVRESMSPAEKKELEDLEAEEARKMAAASKKMVESMAAMVAIRVDTPAADVADFIDVTNDTSTIFGLAFGTKVDGFKPVNDGDGFPFGALMQGTKLKLVKPVKFFTQVDGRPNNRNGRIEEMTFKGEIPKGMKKADVDAVVAKLESFLRAKYGKQCLDPQHRYEGRFSLNVERRDEPQPLSEELVIPACISLTVRDSQVGRMDPEIPEPDHGDGFIKEHGIKLPSNVALDNPESEDAPRRKDYSGDKQLPFRLFESFQGGLYKYEAWVNPGEKGFVFIKAYEITKEIPLSADQLKQRTLRGVGYSDNPKQFFRADGDITIFEGDWGQYYGARFELWFAPATGAPERKLLERSYKIDGWMR